jgi:replicative DNA helicase
MGLRPEFFTGSNRRAFEAITDFYARCVDQQISMLTLEKELDKMHALEIYKDIDEVYPYESSQYFDLLTQEYIGREVLRHVESFSDHTPEGVRSLGKKIEQVANFQPPDVPGTSEFIERLIAEVKRRQEPGYANPLTTGLTAYDRLGWHERGTLAVLAGGSGHGKSSFALNLVLRWLRNDLKVLYITYEMTEEVCLGKLACISGGIPWGRAFVTRGERLDENEWLNFCAETEGLRTLPLHIASHLEKPEHVETVVRAENPAVVVVDTINFLTPDTERFWLALGNLANYYKRMAVRQRCFVVLLAQTVSQGRPKGKNVLAEAKRIEKPVDVIDIIYREAEEDITGCREEFREVMEVYRVKGRLTGVGRCYLRFSPETTQVTDLPYWMEAPIKAALKKKSKKGEKA